MKSNGLIDRMRERLIERLEADIEPPEETVDLTKLNDEEREATFIQFGEGSHQLTRFLKTAYAHGAPSMFSCSGHGIKQTYVMLKVTDENLPMLQHLGKALSNHNIVTNFENHHQYGRRVTFNVKNDYPIQNDWLDIAIDVLEHPENYDVSNPSILYHEGMASSYVPRSFEIKKKLLETLKRHGQKALPEGITEDQEQPISQNPSGPNDKPSWVLTEEEKRKANNRDFIENEQNTPDNKKMDEIDR